jgi:hypothetical protein
MKGLRFHLIEGKKEYTGLGFECIEILDKEIICIEEHINEKNKRSIYNYIYICLADGEIIRLCEEEFWEDLCTNYYVWRII